MRAVWCSSLVLSLVASGLSAQAASPFSASTRLTPQYLRVDLSLPAAGHLLVLDVTSRSELQSLNLDTGSVALAAGSHTILLDRNGSSNLWPDPIAPPYYPNVASETSSGCYELRGETQVWNGFCGLQNRPIVPSAMGLVMVSTVGGTVRRVYLVLLQAPLSTDDVLAAFTATRRRGTTEANWRFRLLEAFRKRQPGIQLAEVEVPGH